MFSAVQCNRLEDTIWLTSRTAKRFIYCGFAFLNGIGFLVPSRLKSCCFDNSCIHSLAMNHTVMPMAGIQRKLCSGGQLSAVQLVQRQAKKAKEIGDRYNDFISKSIPSNYETLVPEHGNLAPQPLKGLSFAVKDNFCVQGFRTTCASKMLDDFVPGYNATVVQRLLDAGAVLFGKTNLDEFAMGSGSVDSHVGAVKNVWGFPDHIAGGSSGGSAVAVASGAVHFALGSDTGGSVRNPASYCGIVGFKPSYGMVSRHGLIPLVNSTDVPSIFAPFVEDAKIVYEIISGYDTKDSTTLDNSHRRTATPSHKLRVGIPKEYNVPELSSEVRDCWMRVADRLEECGAEVEEVSLPHSEYGNACYTVICACDVASNMARYDGIEFGHRSHIASSTNELYAKSRHEGLNEVVRGRILAGNFFLLKSNSEEFFGKAAKVRRLIKQDFDDVFSGGVDVLLTPVTLSDAPTFKEFVSLDNRTQQEVQDLFTVGASLAGLPAITVPISLSAKGLPLGMQLIGRYCDDVFLLSVAEKVEKLFEFIKRSE